MMIQKEELIKLMMQMTEILKSKDLSADEILGSTKVAELDAVLRGVYKEALEKKIQINI